MEIETIKEMWVNNMDRDIDASVKAWNSVATEAVYNKIPVLYADPFFRFLTDKITLTKEMTSLDIGCGAGVYTTALAPHIKKAVGVDFSPKMISLAKNLAAEQKAENVEFLCENWYTYDVTPLEKQFDIVFAHMTPAIVDFSTFEKMIRCSKKYCLIEKPTRRTDREMDALRAKLHLSAEPEKEDSVPLMFNALWAMGYSPQLSYRQEVWQSERTVADAVTWYLGRLKGFSPLTEDDEAKVVDYLKSHAVDGKIKEHIETTVVSMFWEVTL